MATTRKGAASTEDIAALLAACHHVQLTAAPTIAESTQWSTLELGNLLSWCLQNGLLEKGGNIHPQGRQETWAGYRLTEQGEKYVRRHGDFEEES